MKTWQRPKWLYEANVLELTHGSIRDDEFIGYLKRLRPTAVNLLGTSHDGVMNYPAKIGPSHDAGTCEKTLGRIKQARSLGIKIISQHSGVGNTAAGDAHPEWIRIEQNGEPSSDKFAGHPMCLTSPYAAEWFLPQVDEMTGAYGADALWVDGDCWYLWPCYCDRCVARFKEETGLEPPHLPKEQIGLTAPTPFGRLEDVHTDPPPPETIAAWRKWMAFHRKIFRAFQKSAADVCHKNNAAYASNWSYTYVNPDPVPEWVDWLTGDTPEFENTGAWCASLKARFDTTQGCPHDVMTWDQVSHNPWSKPPFQTYPKGRDQLRQEVASAIANGAIWYNWTSRYNPAGCLETADFVHQRSDMLRGTESLAEIALLHTTTSFYVHSEGFMQFKPGNRPIWGGHRVLLYGGRHHDIVNEVNFARRMNRYRLVILAGQTHLDDATRARLREFVEQGGRLLIAGRSGLGDGNRQTLADLLGLDAECRIESKLKPFVKVAPEIVDEAPVDDPNVICALGMDIDLIRVRPVAAEVVLANLEPANGNMPNRVTGWLAPGSFKESGTPLLTRNRFGKGEAWYLAAGVFGHYERIHYFGLRRFILSIIDQILPAPRFLTEADGPIELSVRYQQSSGATFCHLVNIAVEAVNISLETQYERAVPRGPVTLKVRMVRPPKTVTLEPGGRAVDYSFAHGLLAVKVPGVKIMETVAIGD
jgi:hypothetical protein